MKTRQFNLNLTEEEILKIKNEAERLRGTQSQVVRFALSNYFQKLEKKQEDSPE